jgi:hypothetical protein
LSFTAEGLLGFWTGGSKENEFGVGDTTAQALRPIASPAAAAAKNKRDTFMKGGRSANRATSAPPVQVDAREIVFRSRRLFASDHAVRARAVKDKEKVAVLPNGHLCSEPGEGLSLVAGRPENVEQLKPVRRT